MTPAPPTATQTVAPPQSTATREPTAAPSPILAATRIGLPIFDTHVHYSLNSWNQFSPKDILAKLQNANILRALVSSSPDEGTRRLYALDPVRILPGLRPYHGDVGSGNWTEHDDTLPYIQERIESPIYATFGEIHVHLDNVESPIFRHAVRQAVERGLLLHIHSDAATVRAVFTLEPQARILWAHAGLIESPPVVSALLDEFENLWTDISIREYSIAPSGTLAPEWRALFLKHPDRITIGSDTWIPERWSSYENIIEFDRTWLNQLPREVAEQIAYGNAVRLFGSSPQDKPR